MKLYIKEIAWGINTRQGGYSERVIKKEKIECKEPCKIEGFHRDFYLDEVGESYIVLAVRFENNPSANKTWRIERGDNSGYFPRSFDGGYKYEFKVK